MAAPRIIDYGRIETGWREGLKSVPQLCAEYEAATGQSVSHVSVMRHFKKLGIPRDLSAKIEAKAAAMVTAATATGKATVSGNETLPAEAEVINSAAITSANVQLSHRADIRLLRMRAQQYQAELDECDGDLAKRTGILKVLAETQCRLIAAEREAFGMDKDSPQDTGLSSESVATLRRMRAMLANG